MYLPPLRSARKKMPPTWTRREFQIYALELEPGFRPNILKLIMRKNPMTLSLVSLNLLHNSMQTWSQITVLYFVQDHL